MKFYYFRVFELETNDLLRASVRPLNQSEVGMAVVNETTDILPGQRILIDAFRVMATFPDRATRVNAGDSLETEDADAIYFQSDNETFWKFVEGGTWSAFTPVPPDGPAEPPTPVTYAGFRVNVIRNDSLPQTGKTVYDNAGDYTSVSTYWTRSGTPADDNAIMVILHSAIGAIGTRYCRIDTANIGDEVDAENWNPDGYVVMNVLVNVDNENFDWSIDGSSQSGTGTIAQFDDGDDAVDSTLTVAATDSRLYDYYLTNEEESTVFRFGVFEGATLLGEHTFNTSTFSYPITLHLTEGSHDITVVPQYLGDGTVWHVMDNMDYTAFTIDVLADAEYSVTYDAGAADAPSLTGDIAPT